MNERILNKLSDAKDSINLVEKNLPESYENFLSMSRLERDGIYKNVEFAIQNILDICALIVKDKDLRVPASDDDMLDELKNSEVMDSETIKMLKKMEAFRNYLVHRYGRLDEEIAYHDIKTGLKDFTEIFTEIKRSL
ncbi:MAG: HepT-like ribonuclease domain-containing protein [Candidatus Thermoplasmatota archaeon]|nr:HepT-like ribonuclease domain-containing protein [Candidatus Thermoplasmatota archaeon]